MSSLRVVLDTNVLAAGFLGAVRDSSGAPTQVLRRWQADRFTVLISDHILAELEHVLSDRWFVARMPPLEGERVLRSLRTDAELIEITTRVIGVASHHQDDLVLSAAVSGNANFLVTGDAEFLNVGGYRGVRICSPAEFLNALDRN